ncbi:hypothetical protein V1506DRAFT_547068 [Lipomyces tetrasporus]
MSWKACATPFELMITLHILIRIVYIQAGPPVRTLGLTVSRRCAIALDRHRQSSLEIPEIAYWQMLVDTIESQSSLTLTSACQST